MGRDGKGEMGDMDGRGRHSGLKLFSKNL